jgi:ATP-dependent helicase/DNAse subunit B
MERGPDKKYLPVKTGADGLPSGDALAGPAQFEALSGYIDKMLVRLARDVRGGSIEARPYWKSRDDTACAYCDYRVACHFSEKDGDTRRYLKKLKADEAWLRIAEGADE